MILGRISYLDCLVFVTFLIPQLLLHTNLFQLIDYGIRALPFLLIRLPYSFISERYVRPKRSRSPFCRQASPFQDLVIRCVRYAFANFPPTIGRVFFSKSVVLPFLRFRMLRHGIIHSPISWSEVDHNGVRGLLIREDSSKPHDIVIYYCHGGGFYMGSAYFYLEPLLVLNLFLKDLFNNPAIFALEYTLVPEAIFPTQLAETIAGYDYALSLASANPDRVCVAGDSAGGTLILSLLLYLSRNNQLRPAYATLISPWITLVSSNNKNTPSDYLDAERLHMYGARYAGKPGNLQRPLVSPGSTCNQDWWANAAPSNGFYVTYGSEEVFAAEIRRWVRTLRQAAVGVRVDEEPGAVHAWLIARLFLENTQEARAKGMKDLVRAVAANVGTGTKLKV